MVGFAVGDALGMPVEGMSREDIRRIYGRVEDYLPSPYGDLKEGEWTDDTEQMLILAESILERVYFDPEDFSKRLAMISSTRIGPTTRRALLNLHRGWRHSGVDSDTCGSAMRVLPIGLVYSFSLDLVEKYAYISSIVTHRGVAVWGAVAMAIGVACVVEGAGVEEVVEEVCKRVEDELLREKIELAYELEDVDEAIDRIGTSMSVYESVPFAFYCFFSSKSFEECALKAVNAGGDTDTVCAMACGLKGCELGFDAIPKRWVERLKDVDRIIEIADRLYELHRRIR